MGFYPDGPPVNLYFVPSRKGEGEWDAYIIGDGGETMEEFSVSGGKEEIDKAYGEGTHEKMGKEWESGDRALDGEREVGYLLLDSPAHGSQKSVAA